MSRPIPLDIIPSHVYLSEEDQAVLFGVGYAMTIAGEYSQPGQVVYQETVEVFGRLKRSVTLRVCGPAWERSHVEVTPTEVVYLGLSAEEVKTGHLAEAQACRLVGPVGEVKLKKGLIIPKPHIMCSPEEAQKLHLRNGQLVDVDISSAQGGSIDDVIIRVHPTFKMRMEVHQDYARDLWLTRSTHVRIRGAAM